MLVRACVCVCVGGGGLNVCVYVFGGGGDVCVCFISFVVFISCIEFYQKSFYTPLIVIHF